MPNITRRVGGRMSGLMRYLVDVDPTHTRNVHTEPHLVAGSPSIMAWHDDAELNVPAALAIARELEEPYRVYGVEPYGGHVWHVSLSNDAEQGLLTDEQWGEIGEEFLRRTGMLDESKAPVRYAIVRHGLSRGGNDHAHVAVSLVREDGTKASTWNDRPRAQAACTAIEQKFGLAVLESRAAGRGSRGLSRAELERAERLRLPEPERRTLARMVRGCATASADEAEFVRRLRAAGLAPRPHFAAGTGETVVSGYSAARAAAPGEKPLRLGGTNMAKDLSLPRLRESMGWPDTPQAADAAVAEWVAAKRGRPVVAPGAEAPVLDPALARAYANEVGALREWLTTIPEGETVTWAAASRQIGGVFAEWSRAAEGANPGPLAEAADALAAAGERAAWADHPVRKVPRVRGAAAFIAVVGRSPTAETALLLRQLSNTAKALRDHSEAAGELAAARAVERVMRERLAAVRAAQPPLELPPRPPARQGPGPAGSPVPNRLVQRHTQQRTHSDRGVER